MRLIDADTVVTIQVYDDMTEETDTKKMTIAEAIDEWSDEGCPPTVDAEPVKHGHWTDNGHIGKRRWCSLCGGIAFEQYDDYGLVEVTESDYCPHCGAKMDEVEDI